MWSRQLSLLPEDHCEQALLNPQLAGSGPAAAHYSNTQVCGICGAASTTLCDLLLLLCPVLASCAWRALRQTHSNKCSHHHIRRAVPSHWLQKASLIFHYFTALSLFIEFLPLMADCRHLMPRTKRRFFFSF